MDKQDYKYNKRKLVTTGMVVLGVSLIISGSYAVLSDALSHNETIVVEWVDIMDNNDTNLALEDINDVTNTPVTDLIPGVTYELTGTLENNSTVVTDWNATNVTNTTGMTVNVADGDGNNAPVMPYEAIDVSQFGITVRLDESISTNTQVNLKIKFDATDARDEILEQPTAISAIFTDPNLALCVANDDESGANGDVNYLITQEQLNGFNDLDCIDQGITNLEGMQYMFNLTDLALDFNQISNLEPLAGLNDLVVLTLGANQITSIEHLEGLTNLQTLYLGENQVTDISPMANLENLQVIDLHMNEVSDVTPLANLNNLTNVKMQYNQISDFSSLTYQPATFWADYQTIILPDVMLSTSTQINIDGINGQDLTITWTTPGSYVNGQLMWDNPGVNSLTYVSSDGKIKGTITQTVIQPTLAVPTAIDQVFNDPALAACVANDDELVAITGGNVNYQITQADLASINELVCREMNITDLEGIQYMHNLTTLDLAFNQITDYEQVAFLVNLEYLDIGGNMVTTLDPIVNLNNLVTLKMGENQISDIDALSHLKSLEWVDLHQNNIKDISAVANLVNLTHLNLSYNYVSDISSLVNLPNLYTLSLNYNQITDFSVLTYLPGAFSANGQNVVLADVAPGVATPITITGINNAALTINWGTPGTYSSEQLTWTNPGVNSLTYVSSDGRISGTITQNVNNFAQATAISTVFPDPALATCVANDDELISITSGDINYLITKEDLMTVTDLSCSGVGIVSIEGLQYMSNLVALDLGYNEITDLAPISYLTNLTDLYLAFNNITDLTPVANLENLIYFDAGANMIETIAPLANLTSLERLYLGQNEIISITPVSNLDNLTHVDFHSNQISSVAPLSHLMNLEVLKLSGNKISDFSPLTYQPETFEATNQSITLPQTYLANGTAIAIDGINGVDLTLTWIHPGRYENGKIYWEYGAPGNKTVNFASSDGKITGSITQYVQMPPL